MRTAVLGSGRVGATIGRKLVELGHEVVLGSRDPTGDGAVAWSATVGAEARSHTNAARFADIVFNCTAGMGSLAALESAGAEALAGKLLIDLANPLVHGPAGTTLGIGGGGADSLGERIQAAYPDTRVVKTLNTVTRDLMVDPALVGGDHVIFVCGDDAAAKAEVVALLGTFGWPAKRVVDLGEITAARATEAYLLLWVRLWSVLGTTTFNVVPVVAGD